MGFFFKKSKNAGLARVNFSKSGIGISTGIKGLRVSVGPNGAYLNAGTKGMYYRKKIGSSNTSSDVTEEVNTCPYQICSPNELTIDANVCDTEYNEIEISAAKLQEMLDLRRKVTSPLGCTSCLFAVIFWPIALITTPFWAYFKYHKIDITNFALQGLSKDEITNYNNFIYSFNKLKSETYIFNSYISHLMKGGVPQFCKFSNSKIKIPSINLGAISHTYFLPKHLITQADKGVVVAPYDELGEFPITKFVANVKIFEELENTELLKESWLYVKKDGTRNLRRKNNPQTFQYKMYGLKILEQIYFFSNKECVDDFVNAFNLVNPLVKVEDLTNNEPDDFDYTVEEDE